MTECYETLESKAVGSEGLFWLQGLPNGENYNKVQEQLNTKKRCNVSTVRGQIWATV